jgi:hypothetical protein
MGYKVIVKTSTLILSLILLAGVITLAYGYYNNNSTIIYAALPLIFIISLIIPLQNILVKKETKRN